VPPRLADTAIFFNARG